MHSRFKGAVRRRVEKYMGRSADCKGGRSEAAGYRKDTDGTRALTADGTGIKGWCREMPDPMDAVFKDCEGYAYADINDLTDWKIMIRNKDFALLYAGRAVFDKNGGYAGVVVGWNDMLGVILGVDRTDGWQAWGINDIGVSEDGFLSYEYRSAGMLAEPPGEPMEEEAPKHKTAGGLIREHEGVRGIRFPTDGHGGMKPVSAGDGLENVSSKI